MQDSGQIDGKVLGQRIGLTVCAAAFVYTLFGSMGPSGTFQSTSKPAKPQSAWAAESAGEDEEDSGWGNNTRGGSSSESSRTARARTEAQRAARQNGSTASDIPVYDAGKDGGWGGN